MQSALAEDFLKPSEEKKTDKDDDSKDDIFDVLQHWPSVMSRVRHGSQGRDCFQYTYAYALGMQDGIRRKTKSCLTLSQKIAKNKMSQDGK